MNTGLLRLLSDIGLLDRALVEQAEDGQRLLRAVCPVHEHADNPTSFVLDTGRWFCNTAECHRTYGAALEGLVVALAHRHGKTKEPLPFRKALEWVRQNKDFLREIFADWPTSRTPGRASRKSSDAFACSRRAALAGLSVPSWYFLNRGFDFSMQRPYDIGQALDNGVFRHVRGWAVVPLYDPADGEKCVGYAARTHELNAEPRWKMSPGLKNAHRLFNVAAAREANGKTGQLILVEGVPDALRCVEAGFPQAISVLGSSLFDEQIERLSAFRLDEVVVVGDNDAAGEKFAAQVVEKLTGRAGVVRSVRPPARVKDVGDLTRDQARAFLADTLRAKSLCA